jgi:5-methyltetrahydrofolate--homocysteine methyltransferase
VNVGERTNVTGSKAFARLILAGNYAEALSVARQQVENGAQVIDVNMDEAMLDSEKAMTDLPEPRSLRTRHSPRAGDGRFLQMERDRSWPEMPAGQGHRQFDQLKEGEDEFLRQARLVRMYGAAAVVMAFDEQGQADTLRRRIAICQRAYDLLTQKAGLPPRTSFSIPISSRSPPGWRSTRVTASTIIEAVNGFAPTCLRRPVSGGVSNFVLVPRQRPGARSHAHGVPLPRVKAGMTMGIVNAGSSASTRRSTRNCASAWRT